MTSIVGARHLSKSFGAIAALKDVSLDIAPGEIRAICGENGAGKSTLVKLLTGVYRPDSGSVTVQGRRGRSQRPGRPRSSALRSSRRS